MSNIILTTTMLCRELLVLIDESNQSAPIDKWIEIDFGEELLTTHLDEVSKTVLRPALASAVSGRPNITIPPAADQAYHGVRVRCWTCFDEDRRKLLFLISAYQQAAA